MAIDLDKLIKEIEQEISSLQEDLSAAKRVRARALNRGTSNNGTSVKLNEPRDRSREVSFREDVQRMKKPHSVPLREAQLKALELLGEYVDANEWKKKVGELYPEHENTSRSAWANGVNYNIKEGHVKVHIPTSGGKPSIYYNLKKFPELSDQRNSVDESVSVPSLSTT